MADLDNFLDGEEWDSDTESVPQDKYNTMKFDNLPALPHDHSPSPINSAAADKLEREAYIEQMELKQSRQLSNERKVNPPPSPQQSTESAQDFSQPPPMPPLSPYSASPSFPAAGASSVGVAEKKTPVTQNNGISPVRKVSQNIQAPPQRKFSQNFASRKQSANVQTERKMSENFSSRKGSTNFQGRQMSKFGGGQGQHSKEKKEKGYEQKYSADVVDFFSKVNQKSITQQAIEYLNAYWGEVGDQAEFIFSVAIRLFREADMHRQGVSLIYKYDEGCDVDYPTYLYFYEKLVKFVNQNPEWREGKWEKSAVYEVKTAIKHKNDLKEKVDVNFDGRISFLEFLLYQYNIFSNPADYMQRAMVQAEEHPAITAARLALEKVNEKIRAYEEERARLTAGAAQPGVKGLTFKHQLTMLDKGPLSEQLNEALITAEAAVRMAVRKFQGAVGSGVGVVAGAPQGALWWMQRDLEDKKRVMVPNTLRRIKKKN